MTALAFLSVLAALAFLWLGSGVFFLKSRTPANKLFALFAACAAYLSFLDFELSQCQDPQTAQLLSRLYSLWPLAPALLLHFVLVFTHAARPKRSNWIVALLYAGVVVLVFLHLSQSQLVSAGEGKHWGWENVMGVGAASLAFVFWSSFVCVLSIYLVVKHWAQMAKGAVRRQAGHVAVGVALFHISGVVTGGILPIYRLQVTGLTAVASLFGAAVITNAIRRLGLFSVTAEIAADAILSTMSDLVFLVNLDGKIIRVNQAAALLLGYGETELVGQPVSAVFVEGFGEIATPTARTDAETVVTSKGGETTSVSLSTSVIKADGGTDIGIVGVGRSIVERKRFEAALRQSEARFRSLFECAPELIFLLHKDGRIAAANRCATEMLEVEAGKLVERPFVALLAPGSHDAFAKQLAAARDGTSSREELELVCRDGRLLSVDSSAMPVCDANNQIESCVVYQRDITERKRQQQTYAKKVTAAQDQERRRIARELHDETGQMLGCLIAELSIFEADTVDETAKERLRELRQRAASTLQEIQRISRGMHPGVLDVLGLPAALERCTEEFSRSSGIPARLEIVGLDSGERMGLDIEITVYRAVQEALTNVAKHARANTVSVLVVRKEGVVRAIVEDDGRGFDVVDDRGLAIEGPHLGLLGIRERTELLGGQLVVESQPGAGTTLKIDIPLPG